MANSTKKIDNKDLDKVNGGQRDYEIPKDKIIITKNNNTKTEVDTNPDHMDIPVGIY